MKLVSWQKYVPGLPRDPARVESRMLQVQKSKLIRLKMLENNRVRSNILLNTQYSFQLYIKYKGNIFKNAAAW